MTRDPNVRPCNGPRCGVDVRWVLTEGGKRMPLDLEPDPEGNVYRVLVDGKPRARVLGGGDHRPPDGTVMFRPHWATCPDSEVFKRRQAAAIRRCHGCQQPMDPVLGATELYHPTCAPDPATLRAALRAGTAPDSGQGALPL